MMGSIWGRLILSLVLLAVTFVIESAVLRAAAKRAHELRKLMARSRARLDKALSSSVRKEPAQGGNDPKAGAAGRSSKPQSPEEKQARKDWTRAHLIKHSSKPDWKHDAEYLNLLLSSARGGCGEAMNQLGKYAFDRRAYVEAYFWVLKMEMAGVRNIGQPASSIIRHWLKHRTPKKHHRFHAGFEENQYRFARAVMRIRSGVDREKGLKRLRLLVEAGYEDVRQFVKANGLEEDVSKVKVHQPKEDAGKML